VVGRPEPSETVRRIRREMRDGLGIDTIEIGQMLETALQIRRLLAQNHLVAMLLDRHLGRDRVDVTFFGRPTPFLRSPAMIAQMSGAPLLPAFVVRRADGRFDGWFGEPVYVDRARATDDAIQSATQAFAQQLETQIRLHPHLWYQFYRYWDAAPVAPA
jgi:KDO2-lipid IV(A) lauroyltransferase